MEAIILAGGLGTRLKNIVNDVPKPMAPISGRPFLEILLESLIAKGFKRVILSLCHMPEKISDHFGNSYKDIEIIYSIETSPLGTGGAIKRSLKLASNKDIFIINGDTFLDLDYKKVYACYLKNKDPLIVIRKVSNLSRYGEVKVKNDKIISFGSRRTNKKAGYINAGCYIFQKEIFDEIDLEESFSIENDFFPTAIKEKPYQFYVLKDLFIDIGIPSDFKKAQLILKDIYAN